MSTTTTTNQYVMPADSPALFTEQVKQSYTGIERFVSTRPPPRCGLTAMPIPTRAPPFIERMPASGSHERLDVGTLALAAPGGDERTWEELTRRFAPLLGRVARGFGLSSHDADNVAQNTWLRLLERGDTLRDPEALPGWLTTTARRECLRLLQRAVREEPVGDVALDGEAPSAEDVALLAEVCTTMAAAVARLPPRQRQLVSLLLENPEHSYQELAARTGTPTGSIGPTLIRAITRLRRDPGIARLDPTR